MRKTSNHITHSCHLPTSGTLRDLHAPSLPGLRLEDTPVAPHHAQMASRSLLTEQAADRPWQGIHTLWGTNSSFQSLQLVEAGVRDTVSLRHLLWKRRMQGINALWLCGGETTLFPAQGTHNARGWSHIWGWPLVPNALALCLQTLLEGLWQKMARTGKSEFGFQISKLTWGPDLVSRWWRRERHFWHSGQGFLC